MNQIRIKLCFKMHRTCTTFDLLYPPGLVLNQLDFGSSSKEKWSVLAESPSVFRSGPHCGHTVSTKYRFSHGKASSGVGEQQLLLGPAFSAERQVSIGNFSCYFKFFLQEAYKEEETVLKEQLLCCDGKEPYKAICKCSKLIMRKICT